MKKITLFIAYIFLTISNFAQNIDINDAEIRTFNNSIRINHIFINQPDLTFDYADGSNYKILPRMGFMGVNYNVSLTDWLYTGAGFHAATFGDQGGLFTLGVNLGVNFPIYNNLFFDANVHFGGGGGYRTLVNGGGLLYPSAGLQYKFKDVSFGVQYGYVNFFTGIQKDDNVTFFVEIPTTLIAGSYTNSHKKFILDANENTFTKKLAVKSVQQVKFDFFFPIGTTRTDGNGNFNQAQLINHMLYIVGFEYQRYLNSNSFLYAHVDTMYSGLRSGFMDLFFGYGRNFFESEYINFFAKFGIGAAGGRIFPENGLTVYPSAGVDVRFTKNLGLSFHGGYHRAVGATFEALTAGVSLKYYSLTGGGTEPFTNKKGKAVKLQGLQISVQNQSYYNVAKTDSSPLDLHHVALKINYDLNKRFYLTGETSFAYEGKSGGYAHGVFGLGARTNRFFNQKLSLFTEAVAGVAGGAGVDTGEGFLIRPSLGVNYHFNDHFSTNIAAGQLIAPLGNVNSTNINLGLTYSFSILNLKNK